MSDPQQPKKCPIGARLEAEYLQAGANYDMVRLIAEQAVSLLKLSNHYAAQGDVEKTEALREAAKRLLDSKHLLD